MFVLAVASFCLHFFVCLRCMCYFVSLSLIVSTSELIAREDLSPRRPVMHQAGHKTLLNLTLQLRWTAFMTVLCHAAAAGRKRQKLSKKSRDVSIQSRASPAGDDAESSSQKPLERLGQFDLIAVVCIVLYAVCRCCTENKSQCGCLQIRAQYD